MRPSINEYYLGIAREVSKRSTCIKRHYGAVLVNNDEIISTGYNGSPRGADNCCDIFKVCPRQNEPHNSGNYGSCRSVHAEQNALISASRKETLGSILYLNGEEIINGMPQELPEVFPCMLCARMLKNAGVIKVVGPQGEVDLTDII